MGIDFWDELLAGLGYSDLEWLEIRIRRRKESLHPERVTRKIIIRKQED
jgi:hypothetical protein